MRKYIFLILLLMIPANVTALSPVQERIDVCFELVDYNTLEPIPEQGFLFVKVDELLATVDWFHNQTPYIKVFANEYLTTQAFVDGYQPTFARHQIDSGMYYESPMIVTLPMVPILEPVAEIVVEGDYIYLEVQMPQAPPSYGFGFDEFVDWGMGVFHTSPMLFFACKDVIFSEWFMNCRYFDGPYYRYYGYELGRSLCGRMSYSLGQVNEFQVSNLNISIALYESLDKDNIEYEVMKWPEKSTTLWIENATRSEASVVGNITIFERPSYYNFYVYHTDMELAQDADPLVPNNPPDPSIDLDSPLEVFTYVLSGVVVLIAIIVYGTRKEAE